MSNWIKYIVCGLIVVLLWIVSGCRTLDGLQDDIHNLTQRTTQGDDNGSRQ